MSRKDRKWSLDSAVRKKYRISVSKTLSSNVYVSNRMMNYSGVGARQLEDVMNTGQARISLTELRSRTDRQLLILVRNEIERALKCARRNAVVDAEAQYIQARNLLAVLRKSGANCAELELRLNDVRATLDNRGRAGYLCARSASC
jgi:hypothetical protein